MMAHTRALFIFTSYVNKYMNKIDGLLTVKTGILLNKHLAVSDT